MRGPVIPFRLDMSDSDRGSDASSRFESVGEALREGQLLVLEQIAAGDRLSAVLATLCVLVEQFAKDALAVILVAREDGPGVSVGAAPSFSDPLGRLGMGRMQSFAIEVMTSRLGVSVADVRERAGEPGWDELERIGVRSISAVPVLGPDSSPLGIFATARRRPGHIDAAVVDLIQQYTSLASVAIRNDQRERSLARSREAIREAQRIGHFGDLTIDPESGRMIWSEQTYLLYDWPMSMSPPSVDDFIEWHLAPNRARLEHALDGRSAAHAEFEVEADLPSGRRSFHRFLLSRVHTTTGETRITGTVQDVTERRRTEDALRQTQRLESLGLLAGGIAHDFNNLLAAMFANVSLLDRKLPPDSPVRPALSSMDGIVQRAADLTRQILAYAGRASVREELVAIDALVRDMTGLLAAAIPPEVTITLELGSGDQAIHADPAQLQQVVMNLVTNAVDAIGGRRGHVRVRSKIENLGAHAVARRFPEQGVNEGRFIVLEVEDSGAGMSPETIARMFDPFFTTKKTGRGLGLSAVRGILRSHGAGFEIESTVGHGTRFRVAFPIRDASAIESTTVDAELDAVPHGSGVVLLVEDEEDVREASASALREAGFEVIVARDGREAMDSIGADGTSLRAVVSDLRMPRMSGHELYEELRRDHPALPFVLCTGFGDSSDLSMLILDPRAALVDKPFRIEDLVRTIERIASIH